MTTEREEALELAREAGARITKVLDCLPPFHYFEMSEIDLEALVRIAKQRGAEGEREECAMACEAIETDMGHGVPQQCADAIRARSQHIEEQP